MTTEEEKKSIYWIAQMCELSEEEVTSIVMSEVKKKYHSKKTPEELTEHSKRMLEARREKLGW